MPLLILALLAAAPAGPRVSIDNAAGGGLREWRADPADPSAVFVRDRTLRWYRITLSGSCPAQRRYDAVRYTTNGAGQFDYSSRLTFQAGGPVTCLVDDIQPTRPPHGDGG